MFGSLLILLAMPVLDTSRVRGSAFRPLMKLAFWLLVVDFLILLWCRCFQHEAVGSVRGCILQIFSLSEFEGGAVFKVPWV